MQINSVELSNIGPHKHFTAEFGGGLTGIVGANGSGKSTLVNAIYAGLTGDFSRLGAVKTDAINNDSDGPSYIQLHGTYRGQSFSVYRGLRPNKVKIEFAGETPVTSIKAANDELLARMNLPRLIVDEYVFVSQWQMFGFLDHREAERARIFQYLCGTGNAEKIYKACVSFAAAHSKTAVIDNSVELSQTIEQQRKQLEQVVAEGTEAKRGLLPEDDVRRIERLIRNHERLAVVTGEIADVEHQLASSTSLQSRMQDDVVRLEAAFNAEADKLATLKRKSAAATNCLSQFKLLKQHKEEVAKRTAALDVANGAVASRLRQLESCGKGMDLTEEALTAALSRFEEVRDKLARLNAERSDKDAVLRSLLSDQKSATCSRCRQPISGSAVAELSADVAELTRKIIEEGTEKEKVKHYIDAREQYKELQSKYRRFQEIQASAEQELQSTVADEKVCSSKIPDGITEAKCRAVIDRYGQAELGIAEAGNDLQAAKVKLSRSESTITGFEKQIAKLTAESDTLSAELKNAEPVETLREKLQVNNKAITAREAAAQVYRQLSKSLAATEELLRNLRDKLRRHADQQKHLKLIEKVADVFHWQKLPKAVSVANLARLDSDINKILSLFKDPFVVESTEDLTFNASFPGKPSVKASQLSGGQKVVLATAFRMALSQMLGTDVGMLFLDEPTAGLDADNVGYFHEALQILSEKMGQQRQVIVITHLHDFCDKFESIIEVG
jgi:exonuclease SbcC